ncbi:MAG: acyl carrier protein [Candidatus Omnitrophica bacterium]|nr:acyl carrier protein [Candidatus Omnitrophota bacterium]
MANPLPNEKELFERIKNENIRIIPEIWELLYHRIGDDITTINLLCHSYLDNEEDIPIKEAKKIMQYTRHIKDIVNQITVASKEKLNFPEFTDDMPLHPIIREMLTHYIGNDIHMINFMVQDTIDPIGPHPISLQITQKILNHARSVREFMERLRIATSQKIIPLKPKKILKNNRAITKEGVFQRIRERLVQEFKLKGEKIELNSYFREDLGLDSVDGLRVVMVLEEEFGFEIPDEAPDKILTVAEAVEYIFKKLSHP